MHRGYNNLRYAYEMNGIVLETVDEEKDLGVIHDKSLNLNILCVSTKPIYTLRCIPGVY